eukprot:s312_g23.t1
MGGRFAEQASSAAQTPCGQRSVEELRRLRCFVLGASRGELVHSAPSGRGTLFWNFEEAIQDDACQHLALRSLSPGEVIFQDGCKAEELFIVLSGVVQLQLRRDELDLGLELRPKAPVDEVVALEQTNLTRRPMGCDFVLEEKTSVATVATNHRTTLRLLRGRTEQNLPRISTPESPMSPRTFEKTFTKVLSESPRVVSPRRALRRDDRLLRPVAEVIQALAAAIGDAAVGASEPSQNSFQRQWQQFQEQVRGRVDGAATTARDSAAARRASRLRGAVTMESVAAPEEVDFPGEVPPRAAEPTVTLPAQRQKVVVSEEKASSGAILAAAACMAGTTHKWSAVAGENCQLLVMSSKFLGRAIKKELKRRRSERQQMLLNALGGPLKTFEEEKLLTLATAARTILYRRGEVLCQEGEMRAAPSQSRLLVLMLGEARCLKTDEKAPKRALGLSQSRRMAAMQSAGTLLPGHAVNAASMLAEEPEPFTVVIDTVEALVLSLPFSDLARMMSVQMMEQLKVKASERLAWRRSQHGAGATQAEPTGTASTVSSRAKEPPKEELARLDTVLHDRPEILCQSPRQPPGISHEEGRDMMTSSLSVRRAPSAIECPKVHPALINSHMKAKDIRLKARQTMTMLTHEETETLRTTDSDLMRSCDDWGLRRVPSKKQSLRRARTLRGTSGDTVETEAIAGPEWMHWTICLELETTRFLFAKATDSL